jgi:hypothetical protein
MAFIFVFIHSYKMEMVLWEVFNERHVGTGRIALDGNTCRKKRWLYKAVESASVGIEPFASFLGYLVKETMRGKSVG